MSENETDIENMLKSARIPVEPSSVHMREVREQMMRTAITKARPRNRARTFVWSGLLFTGVAAAVAGTRSGRNLMRWIFTPVRAAYVMDLGPKEKEARSQLDTASGPSEGQYSATVSIAMRTGPDAMPFTYQEQDAQRSAMREAEDIARAGGGRLYGLIEGPAFDPGRPINTVYTVEYALQNGETMKVGADLRTLSPQQRANMHIDEITRLYDAGAGQVISQQPFPLGLGGYLVRFTLADGSAADVKTCFPPGPRSEREAIITQTRELKRTLQFSVENPWAGPDGTIMGALKYKLADGRVVTFSEAIPPEALSADRKRVMLPESSPGIDP